MENNLLSAENQHTEEGRSLADRLWPDKSESIYIKIDLLYTSPQQGGEPWQSVKIAAQNMR